MNTLTQPIKTVNQLLYSKSAIARILNIALEEIEKYQIWHIGVWVKVIGKRPKIISFKTFKQHFVDFRKSNLEQLIANQDSQKSYFWDVYNPQKETWHRVKIEPLKITCTCGDWQTQNTLLPLACCKHCYKVLNQLGFNSLRDYLSQKQAA